MTNTKFACQELIAVGIRSLRRDLDAHGTEQVYDFLTQIVSDDDMFLSVALIVF